MKRLRILSAGLLGGLMLLSVMIGTFPAAANVPTVMVGTLQVDEYYDQLREAFYLADYYSAGACNGWVQDVINKSGLVPELVVDGTTVLELNDALKASECYDLVASREGGQSDYQEATNDMILEVNSGNIRAGDIVIYTKNMNDYEGTGGPHWLHAAIVMKESFNGRVDNYQDYGETRWRESYWGFPTIAHALAPDYGVEYYSPMTSPSSLEAADDGSTGYYVYRINLEKAAEAKEKATATEASSETTETELTTGGTIGEATTQSAESATNTTEKTTGETIDGSAANAENMGASASVSSGSSYGRVFGLLAVLISCILLFLCILLL